jgi:DNA repair protein RadD
MTLNLRPYQSTAVAQIRAALARGHRSVLFVLPTGGGKTVVFSHIAEQAAAKGNRIAILVHRVELLEQASASLRGLGVRHGLIAANRSMDLSAPVQVASVATLARRLYRLPPDLFQLLVVDEAHHSNAGTWAKVLAHFHRARVLGVTATPCRCDGRGLGEWYGEMVLGPSAAELTDAGHLARARILAPPGITLSGLRKRMGDYDLKQAAEMLSSGQAMGSPLAHYRQHLAGQTAIAFCCSVAHAEAVAALFNEHGIAAASIDGTMDTTSRRLLLERLGTGDLKVLTSCSLIGEGVDVPSVAGCILLRPTQSLSLHLQMIGRCLRPAPGKTHAVVLDHVGNTLRHGLPTDDREWSLEGVSKRQREAAPSVRVCPQCFCAMRSGTAECPECGHVFAPEIRELEHVDGELVEYRRAAIHQAWPDLTDRQRKAYEIIEEKWNRCQQDTTYVELLGDSRGLGLKCQSKEDNAIARNIVRALERAGVVQGRILQSVLFVRPIEAPSPRAEQSSAQSFGELVRIGHRRGMSNPRGWARHVLAAREAKRGRVVA